MVMGQPGQAQPRVLGFRNDFPEERESKMKGKCVLSLGNNNQLDDGSWTGPDSDLIESEEFLGAPAGIWLCRMKGRTIFYGLQGS